MQVQFLDAPEFFIDENANLHRSGSWLLTSEASESDISALARSWAGNTGDAWREPDESGRSYTPDESVRITRITCQALDSCCCRITFHGTLQRQGNAPAGSIENSYRFERRKDLCEYKSISYQLPECDLDTLPCPGDMIDWAGNDYCCESAVAERQHNGMVTVTLHAVNTAIAPEGRISTVNTAQFEAQKVGCWLIQASALEIFLQNNALHKPARWAGDNYYISEVRTEPADSARRTRVTLFARCAELKLIEALRSEELAAITPDGSCEKLYTWTSRWRAKAADQTLFEAMLGTAADSWTNNSGAVVCKVKPTRISDQEFEYMLEARLPESVNSLSKYKFYQDNDLPDRLEYYTRVGEMRFSPLQCGYTYRSNGNYLPQTNWNAATQCPLAVTSALPTNWINQSIKLLEIVEVSYLSGTSAKNINQITGWFTQSRISSGDIAGISGNYLRYDLEIDDVTDSRQRQWTRISKVYRKAPGNYNWNSNYWI